MFKYFSLAVTILSTLVLSACTTSTLYPMGDNKYEVISLSNSQNSASKASLDKANKVCQQEGRIMRVIKVENHYQGMNKSVQATLGLASQTLQQNDETGFYGDTSDHSEDYKNVLYFSCQESKN